MTVILHPLVGRHFSRSEVFDKLSNISIVIPSRDDYYGRRGGGLKVHGQLYFSSNRCSTPIVSGDWLLIYRLFYAVSWFTKSINVFFC